MSPKEWSRLVDVAFDGGVAALAVNGLQPLYESNPGLELAIDKEELEDLKYELFGSTLQAEDDYGKKFKSASRFASALAQRGVRCLVLKGMSFAQYYSVPEHRGVHQDCPPLCPHLALPPPRHRIRPPYDLEQLRLQLVSEKED